MPAFTAGAGLWAPYAVGPIWVAPPETQLVTVSFFAQTSLIFLQVQKGSDTAGPPGKALYVPRGADLQLFPLGGAA